MSKVVTNVIEGVTEALAFTQGRQTGATTHLVQLSNVRAIRRSLHMSQ